MSFLATAEDRFHAKPTFVEVGDAIREVRDSRSYRKTYRTFAEYVKQEWGFSRCHAYRLIRAAMVYHNICDRKGI